MKVGGKSKWAEGEFVERKYLGMNVGGKNKWVELIKGSTRVVNLQVGPPIRIRWTFEIQKLSLSL